MADTVIMPKLGFDMAEGTLVRWVIGEGEAVAKGAVLAEIETDKATVEVESGYSGVLAKHLVSQGAVVPVNTPIAVIAAPGEALPEPGAAASPAGAATAVAPAPAATSAAVERMPASGLQSSELKASPLARKLARERGVDLRQLQGSGPGGRIVRRDVEAGRAAPTLPAPPPPAPAPLPAGAPDAAGQAIPLSRLRSAIARRMGEAKQQIPHFYVTHDYDVEALMALRKDVNALLPEDEKVSVNDFVVKAAALALRQFPNLNASLSGETIVQHGAVHMGIAVAVESGLLTVVCRDADRKPLRQIASEVRALAARARQGKVRPEEIEGSTFSISNLGMFDVEHFIAIINPPEAAILAVGAARATPVIRDGAVVPGLRMKATISVDHRVSDGAEAARFMQHLANLLENPLKLLL